MKRKEEEGPLLVSNGGHVEGEGDVCPCVCVWLRVKKARKGRGRYGRCGNTWKEGN